MCFPTIEGGFEVEERRPRYRGEPHRKRIKLVRDRSVRDSDEWALTRYANMGGQRRSEMWERPAEWGRQRHQSDQWGQRPHPLQLENNFHPQRQLQLENNFHFQQPQHFPPHHMPQIHGNPPQLQPLPPPHLLPHQQQGFPGHPPQMAGGPPHGGFHPNQHIDHRTEPRIIEAEPHRLPRASMPPNMQINMGRARSGTRGRSPGGRRPGNGMFSDDGSEDSYRPRRHSRRPRSSIGTAPTDSFDDLQPRRRRWF